MSLLKKDAMMLKKLERRMQRMEKRKEQKMARKHKKTTKENNDCDNNSNSSKSSDDEEVKQHKKKRDLKRETKLEIGRDRNLEKNDAVSYTNENGDIVFDINKKKKVQVRMYKGKTLVDIREFFNKDGKDLPTKKGISLTESVWSALKDAIPQIDDAIEKIK